MLSGSSPKTGSSPTSSTKRSADEGTTTTSNTSGVHSNEDSSGSVVDDHHHGTHVSPRSKIRRHDMSHVEILERVFPMQKRSVLMSALSTCQGDLAKTIDHFITMGDNMVSIQHQLQSDASLASQAIPPPPPPPPPPLPSLVTGTPTIAGKSAFTPIPMGTHQNGPAFDFRPSMFFASQSANATQRENHLPLLPPPALNHHFAGLYPPPGNFLHHFAQTHPVALAAAYEKLLKRHQQETAVAAAAAAVVSNLHKAGGDR